MVLSEAVSLLSPFFDEVTTVSAYFGEISWKGYLRLLLSFIIANGLHKITCISLSLSFLISLLHLMSVNSNCLFFPSSCALVQVYTDGTILVTHGGVEMGQGLHTKVAQIAASAFHIPLCSMKEVLINLFKVFIPNQDHTSSPIKTYMG
ncbi:Xanthine dehydrogenase [Glycine max]|nr:Xanthine dehydrogenase [Glycine max]